MIAWLLIILGFIISCLIVPPIGPIIYLICVIIFLIIVKIIKASASTSTHALNAIGNKISGNAKKVSFTYSSWFILFVTLIFFPLLGGLIAFFESLGVESDSISFCVVITSFLVIGLFSFVYRKYAEKL